MIRACTAGVTALIFIVVMFGCGGGSEDPAAPTYTGPFGTVTGTVTSNGVTPIAGATVSDKSGTYSTVTGSNGVYSLSLPTGSQMLVFAASGYSSSLANVTVVAGTTPCDRVLTEKGSNQGSAFLTRITVTPVNPSVVIGSTLQLKATGIFSNLTYDSTKDLTSNEVVWIVGKGSGTVNSEGLYTPPSIAGVYQITATSSADITKTVTVSITVAPI